jgi:hypothetical protein
MVSDINAAFNRLTPEGDVYENALNRGGAHEFRRGGVSLSGLAGSHGTELDDFELPALKTRATLSKEDRAPHRKKKQNSDCE